MPGLIREARDMQGIARTPHARAAATASPPRLADARRAGGETPPERGSRKKGS